MVISSNYYIRHNLYHSKYVGVQNNFYGLFILSEDNSQYNYIYN